MESTPAVRRPGPPSDKQTPANALVQCHGNRTRTVLVPGVNGAAVRYRMKKHGIDRSAIKLFVRD
ncbi:MAG: hypothetical protein ABFD97_13540 [Syntrophobacter sp.]